MMNRITIKDVAREAGVSVATVSYVLNDRSDKRISEKTRKKVLQVVNLLNYTPSQSAKALATNRCQMAAFYPAPDPTVLGSAQQRYVLNALSSFFHSKNHDLIYLSDAYTDKFDNADAILCYDISSSRFHQIGDCNFIPLIALDCVIDDPLFFQVNSDYRKTACDAAAHFYGESYTLITLSTENAERRERLQAAFPHVRYICDFSELSGISGNILTIEHTLYELLKEQPAICYLPSFSDAKMEKLLECIEYALSRTPMTVHDILV